MLFFQLSLALSLLGPVYPRLVNFTIDDQDGDPTNGQQIRYDPPSAWSAGQLCTGCSAQPKPQSSAYLGTWMDATFNPDGPSANISGVPGQIVQATTNFIGESVQAVLWTI